MALLARLEARSEPVLPVRRFAHRMAKAIALWFAIAVTGLAIGIAGYMAFEGLPLIDAFENAAMILSGMGPVSPMQSSGGKLFAGLYAILSGLVLVIATGIVLAPIGHRILHRFHVETAEDRD